MVPLRLRKQQSAMIVPEHSGHYRFLTNAVVKVLALAWDDEEQPQRGLSDPRDAGVRPVSGLPTNPGHSRATDRRAKRPRSRRSRFTREPAARDHRRADRPALHPCWHGHREARAASLAMRGRRIGRRLYAVLVSQERNLSSGARFAEIYLSIQLLSRVLVR